MVFPQWLTAPDALVSIGFLAYLQFKQYKRRAREPSNKVHAGSKSKPTRIADYSLAHEVLLTNLRNLVSPYHAEAEELNAEVINLRDQNESMDSFTKRVASGKLGKRGRTKPKEQGRNQSVEVRSRRILTGELVFSRHYPLLETVFNLGIAALVFLVTRWLFGLFRSLRLSQKNGPCCSPYRGGEDEGSRSAGAFERLLVCLLLKQAGDDAGQPIMSLVIVAFLIRILELARNVSRREKDEGDEDEAVEESGYKYERVDPMAAKRVVVGLMTTLATYLFLTTPVLLEHFGLESVTAASEEWAARFMLLGNLVGIKSLPTFDEAPVQLQNLSRIFFAGISILWGYAVASLMLPVEETARNAATVLSPSSSANGNQKKTQDEMFAIVNSRIMLVVQALIPLVVTLTFLFSARFEGSSTGSYNPNASFGKRHLQNGAGYIRLMSTWSFVGASVYTYPSLLQSYLDEASTIAMREKRVRRRFDPFNDRYQTLVSTAARMFVFPAFVLALLAMWHVLGGDGSTHPGIGHISQPRHAPRDQITRARLGLLPGYNGPYLNWLSKARNPDHSGTNDALLHMAAVSQSQWGVDRVYLDSAHTKVVDFLGGDTCYPPEARTVKAIRRHVNFLLDTDDDGSAVDSIVTLNAFTGRELISYYAPEALGQSGAICTQEKSEDEVCLVGQSPSFADIFYTGLSHRLMTPSVVDPLLHLTAFLLSIFWLYFYTAKMIKFWLVLRYRTNN